MKTSSSGPPRRSGCSRKTTPCAAASSPRSLFRTSSGNSPALQRVFYLIQKVADTDSNILITGETGTGKELAAKVTVQDNWMSSPFGKAKEEFEKFYISHILMTS